MIKAELPFWSQVKVILINKWLIPGGFVLTIVIIGIIGEASDIAKQNSKFYPSVCEETTGQIDSIQNNKKDSRLIYYYSYSVDGRKYNCSLVSSNLNLSKGDTTTIVYNKVNLSVSKIKGAKIEWWFNDAFFILFLFLIIGLLFISIPLYKRCRLNRLIIKTGKIITVRYERKWPLLPVVIEFFAKMIYGKFSILTSFEFSYKYNGKKYTTLKIGYDLGQFSEHEEYTAILNEKNPEDIKVVELLPKTVIYNLVE